jgi:hypothetical protein
MLGTLGVVCQSELILKWKRKTMRLERVRIENYRSIKDAEFAPTDLLSVRSARQLEDFAAIADIVTG